MKQFVLLLGFLFANSAAGLAVNATNSYYLFYGKGLDPKAASGQVELRDKNRKVVHSWNIDHFPFNAKLLPNGDILTLSLDPSHKSHLVLPTPFLERYNWAGKKTWKYHNNMMHHDFEVLPNGNIAVLIWERMPDEITKKVQGGFKTPFSQRGMYSDAIVELDKNGKEVWRWSAYKHLSTKTNKIADYHSRDEWTHANSVRYIEKSPIDGQPAYLISFRTLNQVMIVSRQSKKILWQIPQGILSAQHDASFINNNKILIFDNGLSLINSRIVEVDIRSKQITWRYEGSGKGKISALQFFTPVMGAVQKLDNNTYLVTNSLWGQFFLVDRKYKIIERFFNPFKNKKNEVWPYQSMFMLRLYPAPTTLKK